MMAITLDLKQHSKNDLSTSPIPKNIETISSIIKNVSVNEVPATGINALDLIGKKITPEDFAQAREMLQTNFGIEFLNEKFEMLFELILEEGWTHERFRETLKWFLKNHKYPNWTIADWFNYSVKLYPYSWYLKQPDKSQLEAYKVKLPKTNSTVVLWKNKDGVELPFQKIKISH